MNFFVIGLLLVHWIVYIQTGSVSVNGDIRVEYDNGTFTCDMIKCPSNTYRCVVSKSNEQNASVLRRVDKCLSIDNQVLACEEKSSSIDPNKVIRVVFAMDINGNSNFNANEHNITTTSSELEDLKMDIRQFMVSLRIRNENMERDFQLRMTQLQNQNQIQNQNTQRDLQQGMAQLQRETQIQNGKLQRELQGRVSQLQNQIQRQNEYMRRQMQEVEQRISQLESQK